MGMHKTIIEKSLRDTLKKSLRPGSVSGWEIRHVAAWRATENPIPRLIEALALYADSYSRVVSEGCDEIYRLGEDHVLGKHWRECVANVRGMLNGPLGNLDGGETDSVLCAMLDAEGFEI